MVVPRICMVGRRVRFQGHTQGYMRPLLKAKEKRGKKEKKQKTARKMAQCVEKPAVKPDNLSSKFRIHMVEREPSSQVVL